MMRREFSSQHHSASAATSSSSTAANPAPTAAAAPSVATTSTARISRRRSRQQHHQRRAAARVEAASAAHLRHAALHRAATYGSHATSRGASGSIKLALRNPALAHKLHQMALPLSPLVQLTTGAVHPHFPTNVLQFWLLTDGQLEALASFYHQSGAPSPWAAQYPCPVRWRSDAPLEEKRRRMGRFIGLRGCESPVPEMSSAQHMHAGIKTEDEIAREARLARLAADDEALRRKTAPGPWGR